MENKFIDSPTIGSIALEKAKADKKNQVNENFITKIAKQNGRIINRNYKRQLVTYINNQLKKIKNVERTSSISMD